MISSSTSEYLVSLFNLTGKVALVTGSSRGLGRTFAEALGRAGAQIIINSRNKDQLNTTVSELSDSGLDVRDSLLTSPMSMQSMKPSVMLNLKWAV
jgi:NAD(P)-dependent dehydrogenase (short-subunit alcohol dehydrogenase family)